MSVNFESHYEKMRVEITNRFGISTHEMVLEAPKTGEFDGMSLIIDERLDSETKLFLLLHLFGHNVQWLISDKLRELGLRQPGFQDFDAFESYRKTLTNLEEIHEYEQDACAMGLQICQEAGITDLDQWCSDWANADWDYLRDCYTKGFCQKRQDDFKQLYYKMNTKLIAPMPVPSFKLKRWDARYAF